MEPPPPMWARLLPLRDRRRLLGLSFIVAVALIWVAASFFVQGIQEHGAHPVVLTFVANSLFAVYVPVYFLNLRLRRRRAAAVAAARQPQERRALVPAELLRSEEAGEEEEDGDAAGPAATCTGEGGRGTRGGAPGSPAAGAAGQLSPEDSHNGKASSSPPPMPLRQLFRAALVVAPMWYMAQLMFNLSLQRTSVTSNTILSSTSALFTFVFAVVLLSEVFTLWKLGFILLLIVGTAMVTLADSKSGSGGDGASSGGMRSVAGDMLCLLSAMIYGAYTVSIRKLLREDDDTPMTMFFGFMGMLIFCCVGPLLLILWLAGVGLGSMSWRMFGLMVVKGLADNVLSDYLWARAILLMGPTIATAGLALQVPLAVVLDALLRSPAWLSSAGTTVLTLVGGAVVLAGFFGVNAAGEDDEKTRHTLWEERQEALQRELDFDLEDAGLAVVEEEGGGRWQQLGAAHDAPSGSPYYHEAQRQLDFDDVAAAADAVPVGSRSNRDHAPAAVNGRGRGGVEDQYHAAALVRDGGSRKALQP